MKKIICLFSLILVLITIAFPVRAAEETYEIPELDMTIKLPESYVIFTSDIIDSYIDEYTGGASITKEQREALQNEFLPEGAYLYAFDMDSDLEVLIYMSEASASGNFNVYSDEKLLEEMKGKALDRLLAEGIDATSEPEIYHHSQTKFLVTSYSFSSEGSTTYILSYLTGINNSGISVILRSDNPIIGTNDEKLMNTIIDSIHFSNVISPPISDNSIYTDNSSSSTAPTRSTSGSAVMWSIIIGLLITFVIHPLPIIIYRFAIRKEPVGPKEATKIVIIDAIIVLLVNLVIDFVIYLISGSFASSTSVVAIVVWSFICRIILTKGYQELPTTNSNGSYKPEGQNRGTLLDNMIAMKEEEKGNKLLDNESDNNVSEEVLKNGSLEETPEIVFQSQNTDEVFFQIDNNDQDGQEKVDEEASKEEIPIDKYGADKEECIFCRKCGRKLPADSTFCTYCGTAIIRIS